MLTQEYIRSKFDYHENGWLIRRSTGKACGTIKSKYIHITIDTIEYYAHRVIWLWHYGVLPDRLDHWDGNDFNNRIGNLRECNQTQNAGNANYGEMRGIEKHGRKYRVRIAGSNWKIELGSYETLEEAKLARDAGHIQYFGEFAYSERPNV